MAAGGRLGGPVPARRSRARVTIASSSCDKPQTAKASCARAGTAASRAPLNPTQDWSCVLRLTGARWRRRDQVGAGVSIGVLGGLAAGPAHT